MSNFIPSCQLSVSVLVLFFGRSSVGFFSRLNSMRIFLSILFSLSSFAVLANEVSCYMQKGELGDVTIVCSTGNTDPMPQMPEPMSETACHQIKSDLGSLLSTLLASLNNSYAYLDRAHSDILTLTDQVTDAHLYWSQNISPDHPDLEQMLANLYQQSVGVGGEVVHAKELVEGDIARVEDYEDYIASYVCVSGSCSEGSSGSGSICNCDGWNELLNDVNNIKQHTLQIAATSLTNMFAVVNIFGQVSVISDTLSNIVYRLNRPDDRIWDELNSIYKNFATNSLTSTNNLVYSQINLVKLLEDMRKLTNGDIDPAMSITTEGIISLYSSIFDMARTVQDQYNYRSFDEAVKYFSNTVSRLFNNFNNIVQPLGARYIPPEAKYDYLYEAMTNSALSPRTRYVRLASQNAGGVTNWFQRMEFYMQGLLGWYDELPLSEFEGEQQRQTESNIEWSMLQSTNNLGVITENAGHLVTNIAIGANLLVGDLKYVEIRAFLPTLICLFPSFRVGTLGKFEAVNFDTTEIEPICNMARKITSLIWRTSFWVLYVLTAIGIGRLIFVLVLFVINFAKHL